MKKKESMPRMPHIIALACLPGIISHQAQLNTYRWMEQLKNGVYKVSHYKNGLDQVATEKLAKDMARFHEDMMCNTNKYSRSKMHQALYYAFPFGDGNKYSRSNNLPSNSLNKYGFKSWQELYRYLEENNL